MSGTVAIDDSGTPGTPAGSKYLHLDRKTWVAIIVPADREADVRAALSIFVKGVHEEFGAHELHFDRLDFVNAGRIQVDLGGFTREAYDEMMEEDRLMKGLPGGSPRTDGD